MSAATLARLQREPSAAAAMERAFERAASGRLERRWVGVAGARIELCFAGEAMIPPILGALAHLECAPSPAADLRVSIWDAASTGVDLPQLDRPSFLEPGAYQPESGLTSLLDGPGTSGFLCARDAALPWWERSSPLRVLFHHWSRRRGLDLVHGAVVGTAAGGVLLAGPSGSGKSTTALACLCAGMRFVGDDYAIAGGDEPIAWSLYSSAKLHEKEQARFLSLAPFAAGDTPERKRVLLLAGAPGFALAPALPLRAVVLPHITSGAPALERVSAAAALAALAPSTLMQLPAPDASALHRLAALVGRLPRFVLRTGGDPAAIPERLVALLDELKAI